MQQELNVTNIDIGLLVPNPYQPRKVFNESSINELASSIKIYGIINPILVRKKNDNYEIIAGERRYRAAKQVGLTKVPVIIKDIEDSKMAEIALIENLQRENLSPIEEAKSYEEILKLSNITEQKLSEIIGKSQSFISNKIRLLTLPQNIQDALINKRISERHARSLLTVKDDTKKNELLQRIINEKLTVKELDNIINEKKITEEEIQSAINDIMKSLNIELEETKKEEKESDNMNNGSFFPNMNNNIGVDQNNNVNMPLQQPTTVQPVNQPVQMASMTEQIQVAPIPTPTPNVEQSVSLTTPQTNQVISNETISPIPNFGMTTQEVSPMTNAPAATLPQESQPNNPIPDFGSQTVEPTPSTMPEPVSMPTLGNTPAMATDESVPTSPIAGPETSSVIDIPLFSEQNLVPPTEPSNANIQDNNSILPSESASQPAPMVDPPLFGGTETTLTPAVESQPVEVPITTSQVNNQDTINSVKELLNNNGINYKIYNNETGYCIIIES